MIDSNTPNNRSASSAASVDHSGGTKYPRGMEDWIQDSRLSSSTSRLRLVPSDYSAQSAANPSADDNFVADYGKEKVISLIPNREINELRNRWDTIQTGFVDNPRVSLREAGKLVDLTMQRLTEAHEKERAAIEKQWEDGDSLSTEDMRIAFQRYRAFCNKLLDAA